MTEGRSWLLRPSFFVSPSPSVSRKQNSASGFLKPRQIRIGAFAFVGPINTPPYAPSIFLLSLAIGSIVCLLDHKR